MKITIQLFKFYDLGGPLSRLEILNKIDKLEISYGSMSRYQVETGKNEPDYINYPEPISLSITRETTDYIESNQEFECKIYTYGALSLRANINIETEDINSLCNYIRQYSPSDEIEDKFDKIFEEIFKVFEGRLNQKYSADNFTNLYPVYCISETDFPDVSNLITENRREITALLTGMYNRRDFSETQLENVMKVWTRFYESDYTVVNWNGTLAVDNKNDFSDLFFIIELANIQFLKLRSYDTYIDNYFSSYMALSQNTLIHKVDFLFPKDRRMLSEITKMRVEIEQITDIMDNFEKFFGKWYLAKIYYLASRAFEITRWRKLIASRLTTVEEIYTMLHEERNRKIMLLLNFLTFLLFILWFVIG
jgi:hypothetical protein